MQVLENDLTELTGGVWEAFLGLPAEPAASGLVDDGPFYTSSVAISGGWEGSVRLVIPSGLARSAAAAMFDIVPDELGADEVVDAVGELANIIGGNLKGMVEAPCTLSLPMVAVGSDYSVSAPGARLVRSVTLRSAGAVFEVAVHTRPAVHATAPTPSANDGAAVPSPSIGET